MQEIQSLQNPIIKKITSLHQKKYREEARLFIIEGLKGVKDALSYGLELTHIFLNKYKSNLAEKFPEDLLYIVDEKVLKKISTTDSPCEILAVAKMFSYEVKDLLKEETPIILVLEDIKDPGNLGTIIRTGKAANVSGIILTGDSADIFNPKTVRSSAGNLWKIPLVYIENKEKIRETVDPHQKFQFITTAVNRENSKTYFEIDYKIPTVVMFGSESEGISEGLSKQADFSIKIPMNKEIESLNLSVSVAIIVYEAVRQRQ